MIIKLQRDFVTPPKYQGQMIEHSYALSDAADPLIIERVTDLSNGNVLYLAFERSPAGVFEPWNTAPVLGDRVGTCELLDYSTGAVLLRLIEAASDEPCRIVMFDCMSEREAARMYQAGNSCKGSTVGHTYCVTVMGRQRSDEQWLYTVRVFESCVEVSRYNEGEDNG